MPHENETEDEKTIALAREVARKMAHIIWADDDLDIDERGKRVRKIVDEAFVIRGTSVQGDKKND